MTDTKDIKQGEAKDSTNSLSKNAEKVMELVEGMTVLELNDLVKALEEKFGVSASLPMMATAQTTNAGAPAEPVEEKTAFDVVLVDAGANKINVIKAVRAIN